MIKRKFAANLTFLRVQSNLDQATLALCVGVHPHTISDWECARYLPNADQQAQLRRVFGDTALLDVERLEAYERERIDRRNRKLQAKHGACI
jgi:DNA-binding XRE family transcriptional regulator